MRHPFKESGAQAPDPPRWQGYAFAVAASAVAWVLNLLLDRSIAPGITPFLPAFAAVIASSAWAGFGPGLLSTAIGTAWCAVALHLEGRHGIGGDILRCLLFACEGIFLSIGSARLRRARYHAARSEEWHRRLVETASEGIWVVDEKGAIVYANSRMAEILGVGSGELAGHNVDEYFFTSDLAFEKIRLQNRRAGMKEQFDRRMRRADGSEAWVLACSNPVPDARQGFRDVLSMMTDITERKTAEYALRRSEERFRSLFENVLEGVYQSSPEGRILAANPMLLKMLGVTSETELNEVNIAKDLYVDANVRARLLDRLETEGSFQNVDYELRRRDGQIITVQENARAVRDEEGRILYYEGTLTDITERKRIEVQLRQAQKMEALGRLAGGVANDFSNALTVVTGYAHLVLGELPASHPARLHATRMVAAAENAAGLTQQLLSFSRRQTDPAARTDLNAVIRNTDQALTQFLNDRTLGDPITIRYSLSSRPLPVQVDSGHIRQVLMCLTANVRDALSSTATVDVGTGLVRGYAALFVGVFDSTQPWQEDESDEMTDGMGIATTQAIIAQYGGIITIQYPPEGGVAFAVYLPLLDAAGALPGETERPTILLVDDEPLVREISREMLERHGYRVLVAPGPREAERISQQGDVFDLLITDVVMPQISGPELARRLRAARPGLKVLFISGYTEQLEDSGLTSADTLLQKPFSAESLSRKIRQVLDRE